MILASIEGTILVIIVGIVMVVVRWISERAARQQAEQEQQNRQERRSTAVPPKRDSEEERMRRFMEALGIPSDQVSAPPPAPVRQPPARREATLRPVPPIVATSREPREARREVPVPPPMPQRPVVQPAPQVERPVPPPSLPTAPVEIPQLPAFAVEEFQTTSSSVSAIPADLSSKASRRMQIEETASATGQEAELWTTALRSPEALRSAFILKEILGPPRGLQSASAAHSFPSL